MGRPEATARLTPRLKPGACAAISVRSMLIHYHRPCVRTSEGRAPGFPGSAQRFRARPPSAPQTATAGLMDAPGGVHAPVQDGGAPPTRQGGHRTPQARQRLPAGWERPIWTKAGPYRRTCVALAVRAERNGRPGARPSWPGCVGHGSYHAPEPPIRRAAACRSGFGWGPRPSDHALRAAFSAFSAPAPPRRPYERAGWTQPILRGKAPVLVDVTAEVELRQCRGS